MEKEIRHCTTSDGVRIAYAATGERPVTLVHMPNALVSLLQFERIPARQRWLEALARRCTVVRFDARGSGLSERAVDGFTPETLLLDLET